MQGWLVCVVACGGCVWFVCVCVGGWVDLFPEVVDVVCCCLRCVGGGVGCEICSLTCVLVLCMCVLCQNTLVVIVVVFGSRTG